MNARNPMSRIMAFASLTLPIPEGARRLGAVDHPISGAGGELLMLKSGVYVIRLVDVCRTCPQSWARKAHRALDGRAV